MVTANVFQIILLHIANEFVVTAATFYGNFGMIFMSNNFYTIFISYLFITSEFLLQRLFFLFSTSGFLSQQLFFLCNTSGFLPRWLLFLCNTSGFLLSLWFSFFYSFIQFSLLFFFNDSLLFIFFFLEVSSV